MNQLRQKNAPIREKRLQAISAFFGKPEILSHEHAEDGQFSQRVRTFSQDAPSDILYALSVIATIKNAAIIVHGAAGCATSRLVSSLNGRGNSKWAVTNLNERDSIMGSDVKLRRAIQQIHKSQKPQIIFIVSTPIVAINNDDIESVVEELKDELNVAIVPIYPDGFRSKIGTTGYDLVSHSIVKQLLPPDNELKAYFVNLLSVSEKVDDVIEVNRLLAEIGLRTNIFPRHTTLANIKNVKNASHSIAINPDEANYPGKIIQDRFRIPYVESVIPVGVENTIRWITFIAKATGQTEKAERLIADEKKQLEDFISKNQFPGQKVFVSLPPQQAIAIASLLDELGFEYVGLKLTYIDEHHIDFLNRLTEEKPDFQLLIGDGQLSEEENLIQKLQPELYIGSGNDFAVAIRNGIPVTNLENVSILGFNGVRKFVSKIHKVLANPHFSQTLAQTETESYSKEWLRKNPNWFIKQEVK